MKALTREDLMYILQSIFRISAQDNNAFKLLIDGLYAEDYHKDLDAHKTNTDLHIEHIMRGILEKLSVDEYGNLFYDSKPVNVAISPELKNAIQVKPDGIYVKDIALETEAHIIDTNIHVSVTEKEEWGNSLTSANQYTDDKIAILPFFELKVVSALPVDNILQNTIYLIQGDTQCLDELTFTLYLYYNMEWVKLGVTKQTIDLLATKEELKDYLKISETHQHTNKAVIDKFTESETGDLLYNNLNINKLTVHEAVDNAIKVIDNKLYVKDYADEIASLETSSAFGKKSLLRQECAAAGPYKLWDVIDNYNLLIIDYYYKPDDETQSPGNAKTIIVDTDTMNELFEKGIDYLIDLGYGSSTSNSKIRMKGDTVWVNYYHGVCIYKITGIMRGDINA